MILIPEENNKMKQIYITSTQEDNHHYLWGAIETSPIFE